MIELSHCQTTDLNIPLGFFQQRWIIYISKQDNVLTFVPKYPHFKDFYFNNNEITTYRTCYFWSGNIKYKILQNNNIVITDVINDILMGI